MRRLAKNCTNCSWIFQGFPVHGYARQGDGRCLSVCQSVHPLLALQNQLVSTAAPTFYHCALYAAHCTRELFLVSVSVLVPLAAAVAIVILLTMLLLFILFFYYCCCNDDDVVDCGIFDGAPPLEFVYFLFDFVYVCMYQIVYIYKYFFFILFIYMLTIYNKKTFFNVFIL